MTLVLPDHFRKTTLELFGSSGERWLEQFPAMLAELEQRWAIRIGTPFDLSYNYVAPATRADGTQVVFKAGHPHPEQISEMEALRYYDGRGIVRLLEHDAARGVMLLERLLPGVPLAELDDDDVATRIAAQVMQELWIPAPADPDHRLRTAENWARGLGRLRETFDNTTGPFPARLVEQAERLFADLLDSSGPPVLLHGDLHHWNILSAERAPRVQRRRNFVPLAACRTWLALDPKGLVGEAEYEVGALTRNRWPPNATRADLIRQADRRLAIFSEMLGFDRRRMLHWCMAQAVLSAWWSYEDHRRVEQGMINFAAALSEMIQA